MKKIFISRIFISMSALIMLSLALMALAVFGPTLAAGLHTQQQVVAASVSVQPGISCNKLGAQDGNLLINVTEKVKNNADSGSHGYWAMDAYTRTIKVWNVGVDSYCAVVWYTGIFAAIAGRNSPGSTATGILTGDEAGTFVGGAQILIMGSLHVAKPNLWPLKGNVHDGHVVDHKCTVTPDGTTRVCPGLVDWPDRYFDTKGPGYSFQEPIWGFTYTANVKDDGVWHDWSSKQMGTIQDADAN